MRKVVVVGGGPAGMMAAIQSAKRGNEVTLLEKNEKLGKKLFITGKGRCNITNACDVSDLFSNVISNPKFLYSAFYGFTNEDIVAYLNELGLRTKEERGKRIFPVSDKSSDVIRVLQNECKKQGVVVQLNTAVKDLLVWEKRVTGIVLNNGTAIEADAVILATGGVSYSSTGSTGEGFEMAKKWGHTITKLRPGLVGMTIKEDYGKKLMGLTLKNCALRITENG
ncbi:MAG: aminoacetone oxidase family FAD-binding enzyme, partial [Eubacterium sp.]|nr:aminoacetone oxidase family FAD-binding enzyme [Eubacterium sp.]